MCVAAAIVGGALVGGVATTVAGNKAASAQKDAAKRASNTELAMFDQIREDQAPYRQVGYSALNSLATGLNLPPQLPGPTRTPTQFDNNPAPEFFANQQNKGLQVQALGNGAFTGVQGNKIPSPQVQTYEQYLEGLKGQRVTATQTDANGVSRQVMVPISDKIQDDVNYRRSYLDYLKKNGVDTSQGADAFLSASPTPMVNERALAQAQGRPFEGASIGNGEFLGGSATNPGEFLEDFDPTGAKYQQRVGSRGDFVNPGQFDADGNIYQTSVQDPYGEFDFDFEATPGYAFRQAEAQKAIERSASARGGLLGGGVLKELTRYSQGIASDEYDRAYGREYGEFQNDRALALARYANREDQYNSNRDFNFTNFNTNRNFAADQYDNEYARFNNDRTQRFNRLSALAGIGQQANNVTAQIGSNTAGRIADNQLAVGNANAARSVAIGNSVANGANSIANYYALRNILAA